MKLFYLTCLWALLFGSSAEAAQALKVGVVITNDGFSDPVAGRIYESLSRATQRAVNRTLGAAAYGGGLGQATTKAPLAAIAALFRFLDENLKEELLPRDQYLTGAAAYRPFQGGLLAETLKGTPKGGSAMI